MSEFDFEPAPGLPARLPAGETLLWQGAPDWRVLAATRFHARRIAFYFALLAAFAAIASLHDGGTLAAAAATAGWLLTLGAAAVALACVLAWLTARTTLYTVTSRRVVMRIGIALTITLNIPFRRIGSADLRRTEKRAGDIPLTLAPGEHVAWLNLWPHARPWRLGNPCPMLLAVPDVEIVSNILGRALVAAARERGEVSAIVETATPATATPEMVLAR